MNKEDIKVSVIIPVYNTSEYLRECLGSVVNQTLSNIEIITVNDCSTDNSQQIIDEYAAKDSRFRKVIHEVNKGLPSARNSGVSTACGKYIIHLDSDDYWIRTDALQLLFDIAEMDDCEVLRFNGIEVGDAPGNNIFKKYDAINVNFYESPILWKFRSVFLFFFRRDFLEANSLTFNPELSIGEDAIFLSLALPKTSRISSVSDTLYAYRVFESSMMRRNWTIARFIEEQNAAFATSTNLKSCQGAWLEFWQYRLDHYWPRRLMKRALKQLHQKELDSLMDHVKKSLSTDEIELLLSHHDTKSLARKILQDLKTNDGINLIHIIDKARNNSEEEFFLVRLKSWIKQYEQLTNFLIRQYLRFRKIWLFIKTWIVLTVKPTQNLISRISNIEKNDEFDFELKSEDKNDGVTAMLRVKNEEEIITDCLASIVDIFDEIVVVDNASNDLTLEKITEFKQNFDDHNKIKVFTYPFTIARCGSEHQKTAAESVHSLSYYYNWCLSKCTRKAVFKWDADMLLSPKPDSASQLKSYLSLFSKGQRRFGSISIQTVYVDSNGREFLSQSEINSEVRIFKNSPENYFFKGTHWEVLHLGFGFQVNLDEILIYEVKNVNKNEFTNWSNTGFDTERKVKEFRNYLYVQKGRHIAKDNLFMPIQSVKKSLSNIAY